ncbi:MAG: PAS domain S-box protein [Thermodesulfobacteriota bacterium]
MGILKNSWLLFACIFLYCLLPFYGQADDSTESFQTITVVTDNNYPPYIFQTPNGDIQGILVDEWKLWEKKTGIKVNLIAMDWGKAQEFLLSGKADVIDTLFFTEERAKQYDFTKPYATIEVPVFFHKNLSGIVDIESLKGFTIGVKSGDACIEVFKNHGITTLQEYSCYEEIIQAAADFEIKVFSIDKPPALYYLYKRNFENEFRYSFNLYTGEFHRAVKKGRAEVLKVIEDGFALINKREFAAISKKWMGKPFLRPSHLRYALFCFLIVGVLFLVLILFNITLRKKVRSKTFDLQNFVTQLQLSEEALSNSEERYKNLLNTVPYGIQFSDLNGTITYSNPAHHKIQGYAEGELVGKNIWDLLANNDKKKELKEFHDYIIEQQPVPESYFSVDRTKDGLLIDTQVNWEYVRNTKNELEGLVSIISDVTERKKTEEALRESEEKYRYLIEKLDDVIWTVDLDLNITYVSPSVIKNLDFTPAERMLQPPIEQMTQSSYNNMAELLLKELNREQEPGVDPDRIARLEIEYYHKNGSTLWFENIISGLRDKNGILTGFHGVSRNISERKLAEKEKMEAQQTAAEQKKLALVGQIAGKMAHDFNNVLGVIMGNAQLSILRTKEPETKNTLDLIYKQTKRGKSLTKNLVAFAKSQELKQEYFKINETVDLVINLLKKDIEGIELIREDKAGVPDLIADSGMIEHALVNLVQNAIHATSKVEYPKIIIRTYSLNDNIYLEIEDNGCGIPDKNLDNIYEPAFTLKGSHDVTGSYKTDIKGTGYGMANVKKYIEQHKGTISVESQLGSGSKFTISLPVIKKELTKEEKIQIHKEVSQFGKYILLVEDEQAISDVQYRILTQDPCNHKIDIAPKGEIAIDLFNRNEYDLISLDYILPGSINGMDVYNHIREANKSIPILFVSGNIEFLESIKELKQKDTYIDHLSKPFQNKDYVNGINELIERALVT